MGCIYLATNKVNGKQYVGKTVGSMQSRQRVHLRDALQGGGFLFHRALIKYGFDAFEWDEIQSNIDNGAELSLLEIDAIEWFGTRAPGGYNLTSGGEGMPNPTQETREKLRAAAIRITRTPEHRARVSAFHSGRKRTPETIARLSAANKGQGKGRIIPQEVRDKISAGHKGKVVSTETREKLRVTSTGFKHRPESIVKMRIASKGRGKGVKRLAYIGAKISASKKGKKQSPEHVANRLASFIKNKEARCPTG